MQLDAMNCTILQPDSGKALNFPPAPRAEGFSQATDLMDARADCNCLDFFNSTQDLEVFHSQLSIQYS